jgi:hypothetical protein
MKKQFLFIAAVTSFFSVAGAQQDSSIAQLLANSPELTLPQVPLPDARGGALSYAHNIYNVWDPAAPLSYNQQPARVLAGAGVVIRNVRWGRTPADHKDYKWETVRIDPALIEKVIYGYKTLGTGHTLLVFIFKEGGVTSSLGGSARALTFGAEGWSREPYGYTIGHALKGRYPLIWSAATFESYADYVVGSSKTKILFKNTNLDKAQTARLFELLLARIEETNRGQETYNLFTNSCTNNPVNLINQVVPKAQRISLEVAGVTNLNAAIPVLAVKRYVKKGVLQPETAQIDVANFASFDILKI